MVKLNLNFLFIHYYIKKKKKYKRSFCKKILCFISDFLKNDKSMWSFFILRFLIPYLLCRLSSFFYSDLNLVNKALSVIPLFVYNSIEDKKAEIWKDNKDKYGVYRWINTLTGSSYVGSSLF
jgi:hypothetical protein